MIREIDNYFADKKPNERLILFFMPILLFIPISYTYFHPLSDEFIDKSRSNERVLKNQIMANISYLNSIKVSTGKLNIKKSFENKIKKIDLRVLDRENYIEYIRDRVLNLSKESLSWSNLFNYISKEAQKYDLKITILEPRKLKPKPSERLYRNIKISSFGSGNFKNILKYINSIERFGIFVELESVNLIFNPNSKEIDFELTIYGWGIKLL